MMDSIYNYFIRAQVGLQFVSRSRSIYESLEVRRPVSEEPTNLCLTVRNPCTQICGGSFSIVEEGTNVAD